MEVTEKQIKEWKTKHGKVYRIKVSKIDGKPGEVLTGYARKPTKVELAAAAPLVQSDPVKAGDILRTNCYLGGDEELLKKDEYLIALNTKIGELFQIPAAEVEEL